MKHLDEYRDARLAKRLLAGLARVVQHPWTVMEVCGGQTKGYSVHLNFLLFIVFGQ